MNISHTIQTVQNERGFTLIETFVAVGILMVALVGPLTLAQRALSVSIVSADQVTAFYLAQDAVEYIRNVRDSNVINGDDWLNLIDTSGCLDTADPCRIDTSSSQPFSSAATPCVTSEQCRLQYDPVTNKYSHSAAFSDSQFRREVELTTLTGNEIFVEVTVFWEVGDVSGSFLAQQSLFDIAL